MIITRSTVLKFSVMIIGLFVMNAIIWLHYQTHKPGHAIVIDFKLVLMSFLYILLGMLFTVIIEWKVLVTRINKQFKINRWQLVIGSAMALLSLIPFITWVFWFGIMTYKTFTGLLIGIMQFEQMKNILGVFAGILIIRSLLEEND